MGVVYPVSPITDGMHPRSIPRCYVFPDNNVYCFDENNRLRYAGPLSNLPSPSLLTAGDARLRIITTGELYLRDSVLGTSSYVVFQKNGVAYAENGQTGYVEYSSSDVGQVIQYAINNLPNGGRVFIRAGGYVLNSTVTLSKNVVLEGEGPSTYIQMGNNVNKDMIVIPANALNSGVANMYLDGNKANNSSGSVIKLYGYNWRPVIRHVTIRNAPQYGIAFTSTTSQYTYEAVLLDIDIGGSNLDGLSVDWCADLWGADVYSANNAGYGAAFWNATGGIIHHLHVYNNYGAAGAYVTQYASDLRLVNAFFDTNQQNGVVINGTRITLAECYAFNNGVSSANSYDGIVIQNATHNVVIGCYAVDLQSTHTQRYGINETGTSNYNMITNNIAYGNVTGQITTVGTNSVVANNITS